MCLIYVYIYVVSYLKFGAFSTYSFYGSVLIFRLHLFQGLENTRSQPNVSTDVDMFDIIDEIRPRATQRPDATARYVWDTILLFHF
jgi:hypothetical protein